MDVKPDLAFVISSSSSFFSVFSKSEGGTRLAKECEKEKETEKKKKNKKKRKRRRQTGRITIQYRYYKRKERIFFFCWSFKLLKTGWRMRGQTIPIYDVWASNGCRMTHHYIIFSCSSFFLLSNSIRGGNLKFWRYFSKVLVWNDFAQLFFAPPFFLAKLTATILPSLIWWSASLKYLRLASYTRNRNPPPQKIKPFQLCCKTAKGLRDFRSGATTTE